MPAAALSDRPLTSRSTALPAAGVTTSVAVYVRRSTDDEHQPYSVHAQLTRLHAYIGSQPGWALVDTFRDDASAATTNRPGLQAALAAAWSKRFDLLLVYRLDRFTRRIRDLAVLTEELDAAGVHFRSATEPFDTSTAAGRMMVQMLAVFAEFEREILIDRVISGMERKAARGQWTGGVQPYGYRVDPVTDKLVANPNEASILREIFGLYATSGVGTRALATALNERGLRTRSGRPWSGLTIGRMLTNRAYLGELNYRTVSVPDAHQPLIDAGLYAEVQRILASRRNVNTARATPHSDYHLTGLITCPECGQKYVGTSAHGRHRVYRYYTCVRRSRYGPAGCTAPRLQADIADELILSALVNFYTDSGLITDATHAAQQQRDAVRDQRREEMVAMQRELGNVTSALERYLVAFENSSLDEATCSHRVRALQERARQLTNRQQQITANGNRPAPPPDRQVVEQIRHQLAAILRAGTPAQRKAVIEAHIAEIRVAHGTITPVFKLPLPTSLA